jgi:hypothetical protein
MPRCGDGRSPTPGGSWPKMSGWSVRMVPVWRFSASEAAVHSTRATASDREAHEVSGLQGNPGTGCRTRSCGRKTASVSHVWHCRCQEKIPVQDDVRMAGLSCCLRCAFAVSGCEVRALATWSLCSRSARLVVDVNVVSVIEMAWLIVQLTHLRGAIVHM